MAEDEDAPRYPDGLSSDPPGNLLSAGEAASLLGVSRQAFYQLMKEHLDFPIPVRDLPHAAVWDRAALEAWNERSAREAGRRPVQWYVVTAELSCTQKWPPPTTGRKVFEARMAELRGGLRLVQPRLTWMQGGGPVRIENLALQVSEAATRENVEATVEGIIEARARAAGIGIWPYDVKIVSLRPLDA